MNKSQENLKWLIGFDNYLLWVWERYLEAGEDFNTLKNKNCPDYLIWAYTKLG